MLTLVAAMAHDRVIGHDGKMPWHLPHEFKHFKTVTVGKPVIMGRTTYESLPQLLPQRDNIIISRQPDLQVPGATVYHSIEQALTIVQHADEIMIIGGASIYQQTISQANRMILTFIDLKTPGDTFFPAWEHDEWRCTQQVDHPITSDNPLAFCCQWLERIE